MDGNPLFRFSEGCGYAYKYVLATEDGESFVVDLRTGKEESEVKGFELEGTLARIGTLMGWGTKRYSKICSRISRGIERSVGGILLFAIEAILRFTLW